MLSLLGVVPDNPTSTYNATGHIDYLAASGDFSLEATPLTFTADGVTPGQYFSGLVDLDIQIDANGDLVPGSGTFELTGVLDPTFPPPPPMPEFSGVLLTGEVVDFGFEDASSTIDYYDFRILVTGGLLADAYPELAVGNYVGMTTTSEGSTFAGDFTADFVGGAKGSFGAIDAPVELGSIAGVVWNDTNGDGVRGVSESGIENVEIALVDDSGATVATTLTGPDGSYEFADVEPGTYSLVETQPLELLDGDEIGGSLGGVVDNTQDSNVIGEITVGNGDAGIGYDFGEIDPSIIQGLTYEDFNNNGEVDFGEKAIVNVTITLTGTDDRGNAVSESVLTDEDGFYRFLDLRPGNYTITEVQPEGFIDGKDTLGTVNEISVGNGLSNDVFSAVLMPTPNSVGANYNFGEQPLGDGTVMPGQTATIGFWQNKNGQALLKSLNGDANSTQLGDWLATTLPNMYGAEAGDYDLTGMTNAEVADFYKQRLFARKRKDTPAGPTKTDAQVMAVAFAVYSTNSTLAGGAIAADYGFLVTDAGVGIAIVNVSDNGDAFSVIDYADIRVLDMLFATNELSYNGLLYDTDGDGEIDSLEKLLRIMANDMYAAINEGGDI